MVDDSSQQRFLRAERSVHRLIEQLPKETVGQVARVLVMSLAHHQTVTGVHIAIEDTMVAFNRSGSDGQPVPEALELSAAALNELAALLAWMASAPPPPAPGGPLH